MPTTVRATDVKTDTRDLTVSTVKLGHCDYDTVVFDNSPDRRHSGKTVGGWVIDKSNKRRPTREAAMNDHREAIQAARTDEIR